MTVTTDTVPRRGEIGYEPARLEAHIHAAALSCISRDGVQGVTVDDVAREAGVGRATVYRVAGSRSDVVLGAAQHEFARLLDALDPQLEAATTLDDLLVRVLSGSSEFLERSPAAQYLLQHEPEVVLPPLAFDRSALLFQVSRDFLCPHLNRHLSPADSSRVAEWLVRLVISHTLVPQPGLDLADPAAARSLVRRFVLPAFARQSDSETPRS